MGPGRRGGRAGTDGGPPLRVVRDSFVVLAFIVVAAAFDTLASAIVARRLGPTIVGALAIGLFLVEMGSILDNWTTPAHVREASAADEDELPRLFSTHAAISVTLGLVAGAAIWAVAPFVAAVYDGSVWLFRLFALVPPLGAASSAFHNTLEARSRMVGRGALDLVTSGGYLAFVVVIVASGPDAVVARALAAAATLLVGAALFLPGITVPSLGRARSYLSFGARTAASDVVVKSIRWADTALVGYLITTADAGLYQVAYSFALFQTTVASSVQTALFPELSRSALSGAREAFREAYEEGFVLIVLLVGALSAALVAGAPVVIPFLYGSEFLASVALLQLLALAFLVNTLSIPSAKALTAANRPGTVLRVQTVMAAINIVGNLLLIPVLGVMGAVVMTFVTFGFGTAAMTFLANRHVGVRPPSSPAAYRSLAAELLGKVRDELAGR